MEVTVRQRSRHAFFPLSAVNQSVPETGRTDFPLRGLRIAALTAALLLLSSLASSVYLYLDRPRIAFVRSQDLVYGYTGMREAHQKYLEAIRPWQTTLDSLQAQYDLAAADYRAAYAGLSSSERADRESGLRIQEERIAQVTAATLARKKDQDEKITQGVLNQINSFVLDYGNRHNYDLVLGTTSAGNILYGAEARDITPVVLDELNRAYGDGEIEVAEAAEE